MKPSELFGVVIRMIGFLVILYGLWNVWAGFENIFENILPANQSGDADLPSSLSYFAFGVPALASGNAKNGITCSQFSFHSLPIALYLSQRAMKLSRFISASTAVAAR